MEPRLRLEIVTPEARTFSEEVELVELPGKEGGLGVRPGHAPLMIRIAAGEISALQDRRSRYLAVGEGFAEIGPDKVSVLTDMAVDSEEIDLQHAEEARKRAEARLKEKLSDEEEALAKASLMHSLTQLRVKRRRQGGAPPA